ncbi:hypothetical protein pb186bvf_005677 [Paramecium bursaria]
MDQQLPEHMLYEVQPTKATADAVAYGLLQAKGELTAYPYKYRELPENEVRIRITYTGLCQSDALHSRGLWDPTISYPSVPGHEVCGVVEALGAKVDNFQIGERVAANPQRDFCGKCEFCVKGNNNLCPTQNGLYGLDFGGFSTHIQVPSMMVFKLPDHFDERRGAPLLCAGVTMYAPLKRHGRANLRCAIIGIGGLGHVAVQYAVKLGMIVTAFTTSFHREAEIKGLGASKLSHSTDLASLKKEEGQYDLVLNTLYIEDEEVFKQQQRLTAQLGTYVQIGAPPSKVSFKIDYLYIILNQIKVCGSIIGSYGETQVIIISKINRK